MKKYLASILSLILALAMVFTLVACGSDSSDDDDDDDNSSKSSSSQSSNDSSDESDDESSKEDKDDDASSKTSKPAKDDEEDTDSLVGDWEGTYYWEEDGETYDIDVYFTFYDNGEVEMWTDVYDDVEEGEYEYAGDVIYLDGDDFECYWSGEYLVFFEEEDGGKDKFRIKRS